MGLRRIRIRRDSPVKTGASDCGALVRESRRQGTLTSPQLDLSCFRVYRRDTSPLGSHKLTLVGRSVFDLVHTAVNLAAVVLYPMDVWLRVRGFGVRTLT
jgi:hypothetical protein